MEKFTLALLRTIFFAMLTSISFGGKTQTYFKDDFSIGLTNFTTYNVDGLVPDPNVFGSLFGASAPYKAWIIDSPEGDKIAISTSKYSPAGTANDWLVTTSPINILSSSASLIWKARSFSSINKDGYKIYISTTGNQVTDFNNAVYTNSGENSGWTTRSISLASYAGSSIYIAFVNDSYNKWVLGIDNIFVGITEFNMADNTPQFTYNKSVAVKGIFMNIGNPVTGFTAKYTANGITYTRNYTGLNLLPGSSYSFEFADSITVNGAGNSVAYTLEVSAGSITKSTTGKVTLASFKPEKKVVIEEGTGTWCGYCPRGIVNMKKMKDKYPAGFIGIAVHNGDPMTDALYNAGIGNLISGYPEGVVNRKYNCDPNSFETYYLKALNDFTPADLILSAKWVDESRTSLKLNSEAVFNVPFYGTANFRLAVAVVENNVKGTTSGYNQRNYYAGGGIGTMEGWELLPDPVPAAQMVYQDVARKIYDSFHGIPGSLPATIAMNEKIKYEYTFELPVTVNDKNETVIIGMLIDNNTGEILNSRKINYMDIQFIPPDQTSQDIFFRTGWNIFSSNLLPVNPDLKVLSRQLINEGNLVKIQDKNGDALEDLGVLGGWTNNIGNLILSDGYKIKVNSNCLLQITGTPAKLPFKIPLKSGWNIISYPRNAEADGLSVVQQLINRSQLVKVQDETGNAIEDWGIFGGWQNGIGNFRPGEGYKIKVSANDTLTIYESYAKSSSIIPKTLESNHFRRVGEGNGVDHMNINLVDIPAGLLQEGDEIGVFDGGLCVGALVIGNRYSVIGEKSEITNQKSQITNISIPVTANDGNGIQGFTEGNPIMLKIWNSLTNKGRVIVPEIVKGSSLFTKHESTFVSLKNLTGKDLPGTLLPQEIEIKMYPNPTGGKVYIQTGTNDLIEKQVRVFNAIGQEVMNRVIRANPEIIDLSGYVSGVYTIHLTGDNLSKTEKILLK